MNKSFIASAEQWSFARTYSYIAVPNGLIKPIKKSGMSWLALPALLFFVGAIGSIIHMSWLWIVSIGLSFVILLINYQQKTLKDSERYVENYHFPKPLQADIPFITVTDQKLYVHLFSPDGASSHQLDLAEIDSIAITMLNLTAHTQRLPFLINKRAEKLGERPAPLLYGRTEHYQLNIYTKQKMLFTSALAIPHEWLTSDTFAQLIECLQLHPHYPIFIEDTTAPNSLIKPYADSYNIQLTTRRR